MNPSPSLPQPDPLPTASPATAEPAASSRSPWPKRLLTAWLAFHLLAVVIFPASIKTPPPALLYQVTDRLFSRYMQGLGMTGGHRFFAPEPSPANLIQYQATKPDGQVIRDIFPHRGIRPRLLYHRYFMLSERSRRIDDPEAWFGMYARHLAIWHGADRIAMQRVIHHLPSPFDVIEGKPLDAPEFIEIEPIGEWTRAELGAEL